MGSGVFVVVATVLAFAGGMGLFAVSRATRRQRRISRVAAQHNALPAAELGGDLTRLLNSVRLLAGELDTVVDDHGKRQQLASGLANHQKRPLWQQLDDSNQAYEIDKVQESLNRFAAQVRALDTGSARVLGELEVGLDPVLELAGKDWGTDDLLEQGGRLREFVEVCRAASKRLHAFAQELARWQPAAGYR